MVYLQILETDKIVDNIRTIFVEEENAIEIAKKISIEEPDNIIVIIEVIKDPINLKEKVLISKGVFLNGSDGKNKETNKKKR